MPIAYPKRHRQHFQAIKNDLLSYGLAIVSAPQNVASLRGYSYDENALFRHDANPYRKWGKLKPSKTPPSLTISRFPEGSTRAKVDALVEQIIQDGIDITAYEPDWFRLACAFANEFGGKGRGYFHAISQFMIAMIM
ncbi:MAG: hypothetical protein MI974_13265 [Chitinophagales bacterium]|nr:hypothetical protein [Chitinophagales bacterium]